MEQQAVQKFALKTNVSAIDGLMKPMKILITAALALLITGIFSGCKKNNDKKPVCRIITATISQGPVYHFLYNNDGKLNKITVGTTVTTYDYAGNTAIATTLNAGIFSNKKIITVNAAGLTTNLRIEYDATGNIWDYTVYEYNGEELIKSTSTSSANSAPSITTYTWINGNMRTAGSTVLEYYTDKPRQTGDYLFFAQLIDGHELYRTKNLIKSLPTAGFAYEFGSDGKIASVTVVTQGSTTGFIDYEYQCN